MGAATPSTGNAKAIASRMRSYIERRDSPPTTIATTKNIHQILLATYIFTLIFSIFFHVSLQVSPSQYLSIYISIYQSIYMSISLYFFLSFYLIRLHPRPSSLCIHCPYISIYIPKIVIVLHIITI
jgi:hypothetical protein